MQIFDANMDILSPTKKVGKFGLELANTYDIFVESHKHASIFALFLFPFFFELTHSFKSITIFQPPILVNVIIDILSLFRAYPFRRRIGSNFVLLQKNSRACITKYKNSLIRLT